MKTMGYHQPDLKSFSHLLLFYLVNHIDTWGKPSPSRGNLISIYISILILSGMLSTIHNPISGSTKYMVIALLMVQVVYKLTTPVITAG